ncbi:MULTISPECIES: hypothetical protein [Streptomyces]|uniref:hypothetical protein n=1 Tax=Streptomyces TaxID=1883 RepID=UPI001114B983|nr:hypothetical protein [Streptomyces harbinensis]
MTSFDAVWEELGVRHGGVLFVEEMVRAGVPAGTVRGVLRRRRWQRVGVGAYAEPGCEVSYWMRLYAVQRRRPDVVASHRSAAALLGFDVLRHALEVTRAGGGGALSGMRVHRAPLAAGDTLRFNRLMSLPGVRGILRFTAQDVFRRPRWMVRTIRGALVREPDDRPGPPLPRG